MSDPFSFGLDFDSPPVYTNEAGVKWWFDPSLTKYCKEKELKMQVFGVEHPDGKRTRVLVDKDGILEEDTSFEGMACRIDKHAFGNGWTPLK